MSVKDSAEKSLSWVRFRDVGDRISLAGRYRLRAMVGSENTSDAEIGKVLADVASEGARDRDRRMEHEYGDPIHIKWYGCGWQGFRTKCEEHGTRKHKRLNCRYGGCPSCTYDDAIEAGDIAKHTLATIGAKWVTRIEHTTPSEDWHLFSHPDVPDRIKRSLWAAFKRAAHAHVDWLAWKSLVDMGALEAKEFEPTKRPKRKEPEAGTVESYEEVKKPARGRRLKTEPQDRDPWLRGDLPVQSAGIESGHYWSSKDPLAGPRAHLHMAVPDIAIMKGVPVRVGIQYDPKKGGLNRLRSRAWTALYHHYVDPILRQHMTKEEWTGRQESLRGKRIVWHVEKPVKIEQAYERVRYQARGSNVDLAAVPSRFTPAKIAKAGRWVLAVTSRRYAPFTKRVGYFGFLASNSKMRERILGMTIVDIRTELRKEKEEQSMKCDVCGGSLRACIVMDPTHLVLAEIAEARKKFPPDDELQNVWKPEPPKWPPVDPHTVG